MPASSFSVLILIATCLLSFFLSIPNFSFWNFQRKDNTPLWIAGWLIASAVIALFRLLQYISLDEQAYIVIPRVLLTTIYTLAWWGYGLGNSFTGYRPLRWERNTVLLLTLTPILFLWIGDLILTKQVTLYTPFLGGAFYSVSAGPLYLPASYLILGLSFVPVYRLLHAQTPKKSEGRLLAAAFIIVILFRLSDFLAIFSSITWPELSDFSYLPASLIFSYIQTRRLGQLYRDMNLMVHERTVELSQANETLRTSEARYRLLFDSSPTGILLVGPQGQILAVNSSALEILGSPSAKATLSISMYAFQPLVNAGISDDLKDCFAHGKPVEGEYLYTSKWGKTITARVQYVPILDEAGTVTMAQLIVEDTTERMRAEKLKSCMFDIAHAAMNIPSLDQLYEKIHEIMQQLLPTRYFYIALYDQDHDLLSFPYFQDFYDSAPPPAKPGRGLTEYVLRTLKPLLVTQDKLKELVRNGDIELVGPESVEWLGVPLIAHSQPLGVMAVQSYEESVHFSNQDVEVMTYISTQVANAIDYKQAEEALRRSEEHYRALFEHATEGILMAESESLQLQYANPAICKMLGYSEEELTSMRLVDIHPLETVDYVLPEFKAQVRGQKTLAPEIPCLCKDGSLKYAEINTGQFIINDRTYILGLFTDITERKQSAAINKSRLHLMQFATTHSIDEFLEETLDEIETLTGSLISFYLSGGEDPNNLTLQKWSKNTKVILEGERKQHASLPEAGVWADCVRQRKPVIYNDYSSLPHRKGLPKGHPEITRQVAVPVVRGEKVWAVLSVGNKPVDYTENDAEGVSLVANMAWEIAHRKRAEEALQIHSRQLETLNKVSATLSSSLALDEVLKLILEQIPVVIAVDSAAIFLKEDSKVRIVMDWNITPTVLGQVFTIDDLLGEIALTQEPLIVDHPLGDPRFNNWGSFKTIETWMGVPLLVRNTLIGFMTLDSNRPQAFPPEQIALIKSFAAQSAQAMDNALQFGNAQRRMERLASLHDIDQAISSNLDLRTTLNVLLGHILGQLQVDAAAVLLYRPELQSLAFVAGQGFRTQALKFTNLRLGEGFAGRAALERRTVQITSWDDVQTGFLRSTEFYTEQFLAYIGVPLITKGDIIGVLEIYHRQPLEPNSEWMSFLDTLAGQAAIAIDNINIFNELQRSNMELVQAYDATIEGWAKALELRDMETEGHSRRVVDLTLDLAEKMGIRGRNLEHLRRGALLHDIGKMGVPDSILQKRGSLTEKEWEIMRQHPIYAFRMLSSIPYLRSALDIPYCHHEKWDGTGYPRGMTGEQIPLAARVFAIVDVWDALLSNRPYRKAWPQEKVLAYIQEQSGRQFDPQVVKAFIELISLQA